MGILGPSREVRGPDPYLDLKVFLILAGAALAVAGMALRLSSLVWLAFVPLVAAAVVRIVGNRRRRRGGGGSA